MKNMSMSALLLLLSMSIYTFAHKSFVANAGTLSMKNTSAFVTGWSEKSINSLRENIDKIDTLIFVETSVGKGGEIISLYREQFEEIHSFVSDIKPEVHQYFLINNFNKKNGLWNPGAIHTILSEKKSRISLEREILKYLDHGNYDWVFLDFENFEPRTTFYYYKFVRELRVLLGNKYKISLSVPLVFWSINYALFARYTDQIFVMAYDEHANAGNPGPIASMPWFESGINTILKKISQTKLTVILGNYWYDWNIIQNTINDLTFQETISLAENQWGTIKFDPVKKNPYFTYTDKNKDRHRVFYLDNNTAKIQVNFLESRWISNIWLWNLGSEDSSLWED